MLKLFAILLLMAPCPVNQIAGMHEPIPIEKDAAGTIHVAGYPEWLEIGFGSVWISNEGAGAVQRLDAKTNKIIAEVKINAPCAAMAAGFGSMWAASYLDESRVLMRTRRSSPVRIRQVIAVLEFG